MLLPVQTIKWWDFDIRLFHCAWKVYFICPQPTSPFSAQCYTACRIDQLWPEWCCVNHITKSYKDCGGRSILHRWTHVCIFLFQMFYSSPALLTGHSDLVHQSVWRLYGHYIAAGRDLRLIFDRKWSNFSLNSSTPQCFMFLKYLGSELNNLGPCIRNDDSLRDLSLAEDLLFRGQIFTFVLFLLKKLVIILDLGLILGLSSRHNWSCSVQIFFVDC